MYPGNSPACGQSCVCIWAYVVLSLRPALTWRERSQCANDLVPRLLCNWLTDADD